MVEYHTVKSGDVGSIPSDLSFLIIIISKTVDNRSTFALKLNVDILDKAELAEDDKKEAAGYCKMAADNEKTDPLNILSNLLLSAKHISIYFHPFYVFIVRCHFVISSHIFIAVFI